MALKYGSSSKSSTFKRSAFPMQSGTVNHASAVKQATKESVAQQKLEALKTKYDEEKIKSDKIIADRAAEKAKKDYDATEEGQAIIKKKTDQTTLQKEKDEKDAKAKVDATRGTAKGQVKKSGRLDKINKRQHKQYQIDAYDERGSKDSFKSRKKWTAEQEASGKLKNQADWAASDLNKTTKREERLTKEVGMTPDEYTAHRTEKGAGWREGLDKFGKKISMAYGKDGTGSMNTAEMKIEAEEQSRISQDIVDQTRQMDLDQYKSKDNRETELETTESTATTSTGEAELGKEKFVRQADLRKNPV